MTRRKVFLYVVAALCVALAVCLGVTILAAYRAGMAVRAAGDVLASIFTREQAVSRFGRALPLLVVTAAVALYGLIRGIRDDNAFNPAMSPRLIRDLLAARLSNLPGDALAQERRQRRIRLLGGIVAMLCLVPLAACMLRFDHFPGASALEGMIASLAVVLFPCAAASTAALAVAARLEDASIQREIALLKAAPVGTPFTAPESTRHFGAVRLALILAALVMIGLGVMNGSMQDVLIKAINLCTECVGLG